MSEKKKTFVQFWGVFVILAILFMIPSMNVNAAEVKYGNDFKTVAYYPNWYGDFTSDVQWDKITHVNYAFALPNQNGTIDSVEGSAQIINSLITAAHENDVKVNLAVGGWSYSDGSLCATVFEAATNTDAKCRTLADSILALVDRYGFDGVDIDWEYPTAGSAQQYTTFMGYLREGLTERGKILTSAVQATGGTYQTDEVLGMVDWINVMAYDGDSGSGHSPYSLLVNAFNYWNGTRGVPAEKVVLGVPFYERPNWASYADVVAANSANAYKDSAVINGTTVFYNGLDTMTQKAIYAAENAGGIMIWEISQDSKNADLSLLNAIYDAAIEIVGTESGTSVTATDIPGTIAVNSYCGKTDTITIITENDVTYAGNLADGSYLDYQINVPEAGEYNVILKLAAGDARYNAEHMLIEINKETIASVFISTSSSWTDFIEHNANVYFDSAGTYKLSLVADGGACNVTDIVVTKDSAENTGDDVAITDTDFLKAEGKKLVNRNGEAVTLCGTNAGGYLLQEFWMTPTASSGEVKDEETIYSVLTRRFGEDGMREIIDVYQDAYWTERDFDNCAELGMNVIRLPFWWRNLVDENGEFYGYNEAANDPYATAFERMDWFIREAGARGLYVIIDFHGAPGSQNGSDHSGVDGGDNKEGASQFFYGDNAYNNQQIYYDIWYKIAQRYAGNPVVAGYDLLNEPYCTYRYTTSRSESELHTTLWSIYDIAYDVIRSADKDHVIIMEATWDAWDLPEPSEYGWENVMYEYHNYLYDDYDNANGQQIVNMQNKINGINSMNYKVPSYMGEFSYFNNPNTWDEGLELLANSGISWTTWTYKTARSNGMWGLYHHPEEFNSKINLETASKEEILAWYARMGESEENTALTNVIKKWYEIGTAKEGEAPSGWIHLEAEEQTIVGGKKEANNFYSMGYGVGSLNVPDITVEDVAEDWSNINYVSFTVDAPRAGDYRLLLAYNGDDDKVGLMKVNDGESTLIEVPSVSQDHYYGTVHKKVLTVSLEEGENTVSISGAIGDGWYNIDYVEVCNSEITVVHEKLGIERYEAEFYNFKSNKFDAEAIEVQDSDDLRYSGPNHEGVSGMGTPAEYTLGQNVFDTEMTYVIYTVYAKEAGRYKVKSVANGNNTDMVAVYQVNDTPSTNYNILNAGGAWNTVITSEFNVELEEGLNQVIITGPYSGWDDWLNMDYIDVTPITSITRADYTVKHYWQNTDLNGYTEVAYSQLLGEVGTTVSATANTYTGFTYDAAAEGSKVSGEVTADGRLVLKFYYTRNSYNVTYMNVNGAINPNASNYVYGVGLILEDATKEGFIFGGWYNDEACTEEVIAIGTNVTGAQTVYAKWTENEQPLEPEPVNPLRAFVERMYTVCLGRDAEESGVTYWVELLASGKNDGEDIAHGFFDGNEFQSKELTDAEYIEILYGTFFDRTPVESEVTYYEGLIADGATRDTLLNNFIASPEFGTLCTSYGITSKFTQEDLVTKFVERMYTVALGRDAEESGVSYWVDLLISKQNDGEDVAKGFFTGNEFIGRNLSDADYVQTLYGTFFGRTAGESEVDYYVELLETLTREDVLNSFINSPEFGNLCGEYEIVAIFTREILVSNFVERLYTVALGREAADSEISYYADLLLSRTITGTAAADMFIGSEEFANRGLSDSDYITTLYKAFFNREPGQADMEYWLKALAENGRRPVLIGFANSGEFAQICESYEIEAGELK